MSYTAAELEIYIQKVKEYALIKIDKLHAQAELESVAGLENRILDTMIECATSIASVTDNLTFPFTMVIPVITSKFIRNPTLVEWQLSIEEENTLNTQIVTAVVVKGGDRSGSIIRRVGIDCDPTLKLLRDTMKLNQSGSSYPPGHPDEFLSRVMREGNNGMDRTLQAVGPTEDSKPYVQPYPPRGYNPHQTPVRSRLGKEYTRKLPIMERHTCLNDDVMVATHRYPDDVNNDLPVVSVVEAIRKGAMREYLPINPRLDDDIVIVRYRHLQQRRRTPYDLRVPDTVLFIDLPREKRQAFLGEVVQNATAGQLSVNDLYVIADIADVRVENHPIHSWETRVFMEAAFGAVSHHDRYLYITAD